MSRKANCYDNAAMESFFATLKTECFQEKIPKNRAEARAMLFDFVELSTTPNASTRRSVTFHRWNSKTS
jgi:putative transposase